MLKNRKPLLTERLGNILLFEKESKRKLLSLISADNFIKNNKVYITLGLRFLLCLNEKLFDFFKKYIQILWILNCTRCILVRLWLDFG